MSFHYEFQSTSFMFRAAMRAHMHTCMDTESFAGTDIITHSFETQLGKY